MSSTTNEIVTRRLFQDLWNDRRYDVAPELFHPEFHFVAAELLRPEPHSAAQPHRGGPGAAKLATIRTYHTAFPDLHTTVDQLVAADDQVAVRWTAIGTDTGGYHGRPPTGQAFTSWGVEFLEFRDGRIIRDWVGADWFGVLVQLGIASDPRTNQADNVAAFRTGRDSTT